jgi:hypothetical protein
MTSKSIRVEPRTNLRRAAHALVVLLAAVGPTACSETATDELEPFVGIWEIDFATAELNLECPPPNTTSSEEVVTLWDRLVVERGTVTDLIETSGVCHLQFNVASGVASASTPDTDPITNQPAICRLDASDPPGFVFADIRPSWDFLILRPEKGQPPKGQLVPRSPSPSLTFVTVDEEGVETADPPCTYAARANLTKVAQF